jgi:NAD(P)H-dependent FMN reductase
MTRIGMVTASTHPRRIGHHVTAWVTGAAPDDVELVPIDLREIALPLLDEPEMPSDGHDAHEHTRQWSAAVRAVDAMVLVMPEYNRGYSAPLKNAIDYLYAEWDGMSVACVGYGWSGAQYARAALGQTLDRVGMVVVEGAALRFEETLDLDGTVHPTSPGPTHGACMPRSSPQPTPAGPRTASRPRTPPADRLATERREVWSAPPPATLARAVVPPQEHAHDVRPTRVAPPGDLPPLDLGRDPVRRRRPAHGDHRRRAAARRGGARPALRQQPVA